MSNFSQAQKHTPHLPWCTTKVEDLGPTIAKFCASNETFRKRWAQKWFENFQFVYGNHHVKWSRKFDFAVDTDWIRSGSKSVNSKSQTNIARTVLEAIASLIYGDVPSWVTKAADDSKVQGKRFQSIMENLLDCYFHRLNCDQEFKAASTIFTTYGQVAAVVEKDRTSGRMRNVPRMKKVRRPVMATGMTDNDPYGLMEVPIQATNSMGEPMFEEVWVPVTDHTGKQIIDRKWTGDVGISILTPFEYSKEIGSRGMHKSKWIERFRIMDYDDFLKVYGELEGRTALFSQVVPGRMSSIVHDFAMKQFMRMHFTTPVNSSDMKASTDGGSFEVFKQKVLVIEHYDRPDPEMWPEGRKVVTANGLCTHITKPDYSTNKLDGWHPFVEAQWLSVAPSSMSSGPMNDVIAKNRELNTADSLIATMMQRNMGSALLVKAGDGLDPQMMNGDPGQIFEVNDTQNAARYLRDESPIPAVMDTLRNNFKDDVYETSGAQDALRGDRSKGASSGYMLKQIEEREQKRLTPARKEFERFVSGVGEKIITCVKQCVKDLDPDVMGFLKRSAAGEFSVQDIMAFLGTPVDFGVDVNVEEGSMAFKSQATKQATLMELAKTVAGQRIAQDARVLDAFLKEFGADNLRDGSADHRDRATRENEVFMDIAKMGPEAKGVAMPHVIFEDDDDIHIAEHEADIVRNIDNMDPFALEIRVYHLEWHRAQQKEKKGEAPPGTALTMPSQFERAKQNAPRPQGLIMQEKTAMNEQKAAQAQQQPPQAPPGQPPAPNGQPQQQGQLPQPKQAPQAPRLPTQPGAPGGQINPSAPSGNTPMAKAG